MTTPEFRAARAAYMRGWNARNRERISAQRKARRAANPDIQKRSNERNRRWGQTEKGRINAVIRQARRRERAKGLEPMDPEWVGILRIDPCAYCGAAGGEVDHIDPVVLGGTNEWHNLTGACRSCNARKNDDPLLGFLAAVA